MTLNHNCIFAHFKLTVDCRLTGHWRCLSHTMLSVVWRIYIHVVPLSSTVISRCKIFWLPMDLWLRWAGVTVCNCTIEYCVTVFGPPDILVGGLYGILLHFLTHIPRRPLNGTPPKLVICSEVSVIWKYMSEIWRIPCRYKSGPKNHLFPRLCNLMATLKDLVVKTKHDKCVGN